MRMIFRCDPKLADHLDHRDSRRWGQPTPLLARALLLGERIDTHRFDRQEPLARLPLTIAVHEGGIAVLRGNLAPDGAKQPAFPGDVISNHSLNGVPEFAYGVTDWFEAGLYFPLYSLRGDGGGRDLLARVADPRDRLAYRHVVAHV